MFDGEQAASGGKAVAATETAAVVEAETQKSDGAVTQAQRVAVERVEGIPAVPAVPEGIRRAADIDGITPAETESSQAAAAVAAAVAAEPIRNAQDLARIRELVLAANPDAVPELIAGNSLDELLGSVDGAKAAYARTEERVKAAAQAEAAPVAAKAPVVPAGGATHVTDVASLAPKTKIARALQEFGKQR